MIETSLISIKPFQIGTRRSTKSVPIRTHRQQQFRVSALKEDDGCESIDIKSLSPEARKIFQEAQENILELNSARVRALKELKSAHERIADLERKLEQIASSLGNSAEEVSSSDNGAYDSEYNSNGASSISSQDKKQLSTIVLFYETGWDNAFVHHRTDSNPWTQLPGERMDTDANGTKVFKIQGNRMEFVLTNGSGKFDTPNPYGEPGRPRNYVIDHPGTWELINGNLHLKHP